MNRTQFFQAIPRHLYNEVEIGHIQTAYWLSKTSHRLQERDTGERYFEHPREVAVLVMRFGFTDWKTICAALLHDCVEDCYTPSRVYINLFGNNLYKWILALSKKIPVHDPVGGQVVEYQIKETKTYFSLIAAAPKNVQAVKCADRLHNLMTCEHWKEERKRRYIEETKTYLFPLAREINSELANALMHEINKRERELDSSLVAS